MKVLITGITGQDGTLLSESLYHEGFQVFGVSRSSPERPQKDMRHIQGDITDKSFFRDLIRKIRPSFIFNLASVHSSTTKMKGVLSQSQTSLMKKINSQSIQTIGDYALQSGDSFRLINAGSREMYNAVTKVKYLVSESTELSSNTPYGRSKSLGFEKLKFYRDKYSLDFCEAILFTHESHLKSGYLFDKISTQLVEFLSNQRRSFEFVNSFAEYDVHCAKDTIEALRIMMHKDFHGDLVIASGSLNSPFTLIQQYLLNYHGLEVEEHDFSGMKTSAQPSLIGNIDRAKIFGWELKHSILDLINNMVDLKMKQR